jgi:hypothetical protein
VAQRPSGGASAPRDALYHIVWLMNTMIEVLILSRMIESHQDCTCWAGEHLCARVSSACCIISTSTQILTCVIERGSHSHDPLLFFLISRCLLSLVHLILIPPYLLSLEPRTQPAVFGARR